MTLLWTSPRVFIAGKVLTASQMNEINNNISYLHSRPSEVITVRGTGANINTTSATFVAIDDAQFSFSLEIGTGALETNILAILSHTVGASLVYFDILVDGVTWLSSLTGTALTNGIWTYRAPATASQNAGFQPYRIEAGLLTAGVHTFALRWRTSAATATLGLASPNLFQWYVRETD